MTMPGMRRIHFRWYAGVARRPPDEPLERLLGRELGELAQPEPLRQCARRSPRERSASTTTPRSNISRVRPRSGGRAQRVAHGARRGASGGARPPTRGDRRPRRATSPPRRARARTTRRRSFRWTAAAAGGSRSERRAKRGRVGIVRALPPLTCTGLRSGRHAQVDEGGAVQSRPPTTAAPFAFTSSSIVACASPRTRPPTSPPTARGSRRGESATPAGSSGSGGLGTPGARRPTPPRSEPRCERLGDRGLARGRRPEDRDDVRRRRGRPHGRGASSRSSPR